MANFVIPKDGGKLQDLLSRLWSKVDKHGLVPVHAKHLGRCWVWTGAVLKGKLAYGRLTYDSQTFSAHRVFWVLASERRIPKGKLVLHSCDNPSCVRFSHLFLGTHKDNMVDMINKGRAKGNTNSYPGEQNAHHKLTVRQVRRIRHLHDECGVSRKKLSSMFGVHSNHIGWIVRRKMWTHM